MGLCLCAACGKTNDESQVSKWDASGGAAAQTCGSAAPAPQHHRARLEPCPEARGSLEPLNTASCAVTSGIICKSDVDCTGGKNGRCLLNGDPCRTYCSYDDCLTDTDCPLEQPCACRSSSVETAANYCVRGSTCATDADCGSCGFCSLSTQYSARQCASANGCTQGTCSASDASTQCTCVGVANLAYACHTPNDECTNDSDCPGEGGYCAYVVEQRHWVCSVCPVGNFM